MGKENSIGFWKRIILSILVSIGFWLAGQLITHMVVEIFWFREVGYASEFWLRLQTQMKLWTIAPISAIFIWLNLSIAQRLSSQETIPVNARSKVNWQEKNKATLNLPWLLPVALILSLLVGLILFHYFQVAFDLWNLDLSLPRGLPPLPPQLVPKIIWEMWTSCPIWQVGLLAILTIAIVVKPLFLLRAIGMLISVCFGLVLSKHWANFLQYLDARNFNITDPVFNRDISFYVFRLPVLELVEFWLIGMFLFAFIAVSLLYLLSGNSLSQGRFLGLIQPQKRHLYALLGVVMFALSFVFWVRRYQLLYSTRGLIYGASYTDVNVQLPTYNAITLLALTIAVFCGLKAIFIHVEKNKYFRWGKVFVVCFFMVCIAAFLLPIAVQYMVVQPNELARELPYIQRSINFTRRAFSLDTIEVKNFIPKGQLTYKNIQENDLTIRNIRLWDTRPLLEANRQLQQIRPYYKFPGADIDRYTFKENKNSVKRQVILATRELNYQSVPEEAKTWVNEHLVYTHGYGFTMSPVNTVSAGGLPAYFVKDISDGSNFGDNGLLQTSSPEIRDSIPIAYPRIYYGELTDTYIMTGTKVKELDYPSSNGNVYNTYDGKGGIAIDSWWKRLLFANYLSDWQMLLTRNFTPETKLLFRRNINDRVRAIAPFLSYDKAPYLVVADTSLNGSNDSKNQNYLYWIIDAYTTSQRYPYSDPGQGVFNYIRNSVKVVIDAYNGDVDFYVADPQDPIIQTWNTIFPEMFKPLKNMPPSLRSHVRYPIDLFNFQANRLLTYHTKDARVFYNREDVWKVPNEIYGQESQAVDSYYLIMKLPTARQEEFILLLPFTPIGRTNLIAWLAARSDGKEYGKLLLYQFPKQQLVYGQEQIEALINQDPLISQQISLWNREGSKAIQGNLLIVPIENSLLYVEPLYLEAVNNSVPTLARVIVAYENRIAMAETLEDALTAIFQQQKPITPAIVRPV